MKGYIIACFASAIALAGFIHWMPQVLEALPFVGYCIFIGAFFSACFWLLARPFQ